MQIGDGMTVGSYSVMKRLGQGGMATVYKAFDTRLVPEVALKVIVPGHRQAPRFLWRSEREPRVFV